MEIRPFRAYRFNAAVVGDAGDCIAPPYDVIDDVQQQALYGKNPYNVVRIDKGKTQPADSETNNQYTRAAEFFNSWTKSGVLKQDGKEGIYAYVQGFELRGQKYRRSGFIALGRLAEFGTAVRPHEKTLDGPKADRLKLMRATAIQLGQIFMLYDDPEKTADEIISRIAAGTKPLIDTTDEQNVRHCLYMIDSANDIAAIQKMMADKPLVIADGHHRYETALNYWRETKNPAAEYHLMTFVNMRNSGLVILPTHRLIGNVKKFDGRILIDSLKEDFHVDKTAGKSETLKAMKTAFNKNQNALGLYYNGGFCSLVLKNGQAIKQAAPSLSAASQALDVVVLQKLILEKHLGIGDAQLAAQSNIEYVKDFDKPIQAAIDAVNGGQKQALFFMNPTRAEQVQAVAAAGEKMPQKSTFFYPKIFTGLTINKL